MATDKSADDAVLDDVFSSERDRGGNSAPPEAKSEPEAGAAAPAQQAEPQPSQETAQDPETGRMVPLSELTGERKKLKAKIDEAERRAIEAETRAKIYEQQLQAPRQQPQVPQRQQVPIPDPVTDPDSYARFVHQSAHEVAFQERLNASEDRARDKYGDAAVEEAMQAATAKGLIQQGAFIQANPRHPYGALMEWHRREKVLARVGDDPDAYDKQVEERVRAKVLEELKAGKGPGAGAQPQHFPGTLAEATATGQQGGHLTDEAVMGAVFSSNRDRRK